MMINIYCHGILCLYECVIENHYENVMFLKEKINQSCIQLKKKECEDISLDVGNDYSSGKN